MHRNIPVIAMVALGAACGGSPQRDPLPPQHLSATEHEQQAREHDQIAEQYDERAQQAAGESKTAAPQPQCFDDPLEGVTYSGGEPLQPPRPCWSALANPSKQYGELAKEHRRVAASHRARATSLVRAERQACAGIGETEIAQSPFAQRADVVAVEPIARNGRVEGASIAFRRVAGLTGDWMERALACHYARAAVLGFPDQFMAFSPMALPDLTAEVQESSDRIVVTLRSPRSEIAAAALGRAQDLMAKPAADAP